MVVSPQLTFYYLITGVKFSIFQGGLCYLISKSIFTKLFNAMEKIEKYEKGIKS